MVSAKKNNNNLLSRSHQLLRQDFIRLFKLHRKRDVKVLNQEFGLRQAPRESVEHKLKEQSMGKACELHGNIKWKAEKDRRTGKEGRNAVVDMWKAAKINKRNEKFFR